MWRKFIASRLRIDSFAPVIGKPYEGEPHVRFDEGVLETGLRRTLNGHEAGNGGYSQGCSYELPRQCSTQQLRNVAEKVKKRDQKRVIAGARRIYLAPNRRAAVQAFKRWRDRWIGVYRSAVTCVERDLESLLTFFDYPEQMRVTIRTTNIIERSFREVRRRTRPIGCFTNIESCERIIYAIITYLNAKWERQPLKECAHSS